MKINKFINLISSIGIFLSLTACDNYIYFDETDYVPSLEKHSLSVSPLTFSFNSEGGTADGEITAEVPWEFTDVAENAVWMKVSPYSGNGNSPFQVTAQKNDYTYGREAIFYLNSTSKEFKFSKILTVSQKAAEPFIEIPEINKTLKVSATEQEKSLLVSTNLSGLNVSSNSTWCVPSYSDETHTLKLLIEANGSTSSRSCTITLSSVSRSKFFTFTLSQAGSMIDMGETEELEFPGAGGSQKVSFTSDQPWKIEAGSYDWIDVSPVEGKAGSNTITVTALPSYSQYSRSAYLQFLFEGSSKVIKSLYIVQYGREMYFDTQNIDFDYTGKPIGGSSSSSNNRTVVLNTDLKWELAEWPDWVSINPLQGLPGENVLTISVNENNSTVDRTGIIKAISREGGDISAQIKISQLGVNLGDQTSVEFGWQQASQKIMAPFPNAWAASVSDGWISLSSYQGEGPMELSVFVTRNESEELRKGTITFSSEDKTYPVTVLQQGQYIKLETENSTFDANGGKVNLAFLSTISVNPSVEYEGEESGWVSFKQIDEGSYDITVNSNPSVETRQAYFVLKPSEETSWEWTSGVKFKIIQRGRTLSVDAGSIIILAKGGTSDIYNIKADGNYSISKSSNADWLTLVYNDKTNSFYLVATENRNESTREAEIVVSLSDLPAGEEKKVIIKVIQKSIYDSDINYNDYDDEKII